MNKEEALKQYKSLFPDNVEAMYLEKQNITVEDIQQLLVNISNDNKSKQRVLKRSSNV